MMGNMCSVCKTTYVLVLIGALNWGLVGIGGFLGRDLNVVHLLLGTWPAVEWIVYIVIGAAAVAKLVNKCSCQHKNVA